MTSLLLRLLITPDQPNPIRNTTPHVQASSSRRDLTSLILVILGPTPAQLWHRRHHTTPHALLDDGISGGGGGVYLVDVAVVIPERLKASQGSGVPKAIPRYFQTDHTLAT